MKQSEHPYSINRPVTVQGPDGFYYSFYLKRNIMRAGELDDLWGTFWYSGSSNNYGEIIVPKLATPPCWFKKMRGIYNFTNSGYPLISQIYRPTFGFLVYVKHTAKDCYHNVMAGTYHTSPTYYVPRVSNMDFEQKEHSFTPIYEVINPCITRVEGTNTALMTFWTIIPTNGLEFESGSYNNYWYIDLDNSKICYYDMWTDSYRDVHNGQILARETVSAVLCSAVIEWREVTQLQTMWDPSERKALVPLITKVSILDFDDGPKLDISAGGGGSTTYNGPFKLTLTVTEESSSGSGSSSSSITKIQCTGGYCRVNGRIRFVSAMELPITNYNANSEYEILLHYHQVLSDSGGISSYSFELMRDTRIKECSATDSYCHLGRLSQGTVVEQYCFGSPDLFTFQNGC